jgi:hypothetical protein
MPSLTLWILAVYGLAFLISDAKILEEWIPIRPQLRKIRFFKGLLSCYFCMGIWGGMLGWVLWSWPYILRKEALFYILAGASGAFLIDLSVNVVDALTMTVFSKLSKDSDGNE